MGKGTLFAVVAVMMATCAASADAATVYRGSWGCSERGVVRPIADARVELIRAGIGGGIVRTGVTDDRGRYAVTAPEGRANYYVRLVLRDRLGARVQNFFFPQDAFYDTPDAPNDVPVRDLGPRALARPYPESPYCTLYQGLRDAVADYRTETGGIVPFRPSVSGDSLNFGTPWTDFTFINWPGDWPYMTTVMRHEFGHAVRHFLDGDFDHFRGDVTAHGYLQHHGQCSRTNPGFAFNEGWAEYWSGEVGPDSYCDDLPADDHSIEANVARSIAQLARSCGRRRADMVAVLRRNRGRIHSWAEFERAAGGSCVDAAPPPQTAVAPPPPPSVPQGAASDISRQLQLGGIMVSALLRAQRRVDARLPDGYRPLRGIRCLRKPCGRVVALRLAQAELASDMESLKLIRGELAFLRSRREARRLARSSPSALVHRLDRIRTAIARGLRSSQIAALRDALRVVRPVLRVDRSTAVRDEAARLKRRLAELRRGGQPLPPRALAAWRHQITIQPVTAEYGPMPGPPMRQPDQPAPPPPPPPPVAPEPTPPSPPPPSKEPSSIALSCPGKSVTGVEVAIDGVITPPHAATVTVTIVEPKGGTQQLTAKADVSGRFSAGFTPSAAGAWTVRASWAGDDDHTGANAACTVTVGNA